MAETQVIHAQLIRYSTTGDQIIVNLKNTGADVSVDATKNTKVPTAVVDVQTLIENLGKFAFKDDIADATASARGLMTAAMVSKLNGIAANANNYSHPESGITAGTYRSVTFDKYGHATAGTNPTTLAGYGITDAAKAGHKHVIADITDNIPASKITGVLSLSNIPAGALERLVPVTDDTARFKLTKDTAQNGDVIKVTATGKMYFVKDDTKLSTEDGYEVFVAGTAAAVAWANVTGKPTAFTPAAHTQAISTITGLQAALDGKASTSTFGKATADAAGSNGLVPAPAKGQQGLYLRGDGTWATPTDTKFTHPTHTAYASGFYKFTSDGLGHITAATAVTKGDITALGIPGQDTRYNVFTAASASAAGSTGLVPQPAAGKQGQFLRGDGQWATPTDTKYGNATQKAAGLMSAADKTHLDACEEWIISATTPTKNCMWLKTA